MLDLPTAVAEPARATALAAVHSSATWGGMLSDCEDDCRHVDADCPVVKWLRDARFRRPKGIRSATLTATPITIYVRS